MKLSSFFISQKLNQEIKLSPKWMIAIGVALLVWLFYGIISPGLDYFGCYTRMVLHPEDLQLVARHVWTSNPAWIIPFLTPFVYLPGQAGFVLFLGFALACTLLGVYYFKGRPIIPLLSHQMWWVLYWGQLEGFGILGLVFAWISSQAQSWWLMTLALLIGSFKPQLTFVPILYLWWHSGKARWRSLGACIIVFIITLLLWGPWPLWYLQSIHTFVGDKHFDPWNASIGYMALPLFIPALLLPMDKMQRIKVLTATSMLISPYMPYYSTLPLLIFDLPLLAYIFAFSGYLVNFAGTAVAWNSVVLLPIITLIGVYYPYLDEWLSKKGIYIPVPFIRRKNCHG